MSFTQIKVWLWNKFPEVKFLSQRVCGLTIVVVFVQFLSIGLYQFPLPLGLSENMYILIHITIMCSYFLLYCKTKDFIPILYVNICDSGLMKVPHEL